MFINNIRFGHATNSSSSHSFVYYKQEVANREIGVTVDTEFGWDHFRLASVYEKLMYALTNKAGSLWNVPDDEQTMLLKEKYGHLLPELKDEDYAAAVQGYVDHQSVSSMSMEELVELARDPHVIIYGGNDNDGDYFNDEHWSIIEDPETSYEYPALYRKFF